MKLTKQSIKFDYYFINSIDEFYRNVSSSGHPPEQFKTIVSSSHVHILVNGSLNFPSVEMSDEGYYLCEANNGVGEGLSTVVRLTVHSKCTSLLISCQSRHLHFSFRKNILTHSLQNNEIQKEFHKN